MLNNWACCRLLKIFFLIDCDIITYHRWRSYEVFPQHAGPCASEAFCAC